MADINLTESQEDVLRHIVNEGKASADDVDKRSLNALDRRGLVKITTNKKGTFAAATAKGKKLLN
jgi:hypothetical protein